MKACMYNSKFPINIELTKKFNWKFDWKYTAVKIFVKNLLAVMIGVKKHIVSPADHRLERLHLLDGMKGLMECKFFCPKRKHDFSEICVLA